MSRRSPSTESDDARAAAGEPHPERDRAALSPWQVAALALLVVVMIVSIVVTRSNDGLKYLVVAALAALGGITIRRG